LNGQLVPLSPIIIVPLLALVITLHSSLQHEVIHGHPTKWAVVNALLVWPAIGLFIPYARFRDSHLAHHQDARLTDPYDDPETTCGVGAAAAGFADRIANQQHARGAVDLGAYHRDCHVDHQRSAQLFARGGAWLGLARAVGFSGPDSRRRIADVGGRLCSGRICWAVVAEVAHLPRASGATIICTLFIMCIRGSLGMTCPRFIARTEIII